MSKLWMPVTVKSTTRAWTTPEGPPVLVAAALPHYRGRLVSAALPTGRLLQELLLAGCPRVPNGPCLPPHQIRRLDIPWTSHCCVQPRPYKIWWRCCRQLPGCGLTGPKLSWARGAASRSRQPCPCLAFSPVPLECSAGLHGASEGDKLCR